ncbi:STM4504/CBY_0614 family protein [Pseudomonas monteilii]|uniref:STM4504/CBY_0614 family protein n=1 Tax=Pseudomonas monteilii TaxID=76759 RepID=UPI003906BF53
MAIHDLYSKRLKRENGEVPEIYEYDLLPRELLVQFIHIFCEALGGRSECSNRNDSRNVWHEIVATLNREYGTFTLQGYSHGRYTNQYDEFHWFMFAENRTERLMDAIELALVAMNTKAKTSWFLGRGNPSPVIDPLIEEANQRFLEHGIGYRFESNRIFRIDSEFIHSEVTKPALRLLQQNWCAGAEEEFYKAHEHYRNGNAKEALNECLKSFESLMKAVCHKHKWEISDRATASNLIQVCLDKELIPSYWQSHFSSLKSLLESGVPTGRNKNSGHGQGATPTEVPKYIVTLMLNMTASCLLFICEAEQNLA